MEEGSDGRCKGVTLLSHSAIYLKIDDLKTEFHLTFIDGQQNLWSYHIASSF